MKVYWHELAFFHSCGREGTILEVCVSRDGGITMGGLCVTCGVEFSMEDSFTNLISKATLRDYLKQKACGAEEVLEDFVPHGKPS